MATPVQRRVARGLARRASPSPPPRRGEGGKASPAAHGKRDPVGPPKPPWIVTVAIRSLEHLRTHLKGGAPLQASTTGQPLRGELSIVDLGTLGLSSGWLAAPANCAGLCPPDVVSATVVLSKEGAGTINGVPLDPGTVVLFAPGTYYEGWSPGGYRWISAFVPRDEARQIAAASGASPARLRAAGVLRYQLPPHALAPLMEFQEAVAMWSIRRSPEPIDDAVAKAHAAWWRGLVARAWTQGSPAPSRGAEARHMETLRDVDRYLRARLADPIYLADVARAVGRPQRTLEHTFRRRLGLTPLGYLQWLRLWEARTHLLSHPGRSGALIARCARAVGFHHAGRFASLYLRTFGERPRDTIVVAAERRRLSPDAPVFAFSSPAAAPRRPPRHLEARAL